MLKLFNLGKYNIPVVGWEQYIEGSTVLKDCKQRIGVAYSWVDVDFSESVTVDDIASAKLIINSYTSRYGEDSIIVVMNLPTCKYSGKLYVTNDTIAIDTNDDIGDIYTKQLSVFGTSIKNNLLSSRLVNLDWVVTDTNQVMFTGVI